MDRYEIGRDRQLAAAIASAGGTTVPKLGLRFDRVALRVLDRLRVFAEAEAPEGVTVILTLTAPIRAPGEVVAALEREIAALFKKTGRVEIEETAVLGGNRAKLRLIEHAPSHSPRLLGFVHNPYVDGTQVLDLAEHWVLRSVTGQGSNV